MEQVGDKNLWKKWDGTGEYRKYLDRDRDTLFYFREFTARKGFSYSETNNLVANLKIGPRPPNPARLKYRNQSIAIFAKELRCFLQKIIRDVWITWIPPSEAPDDPDHDGRLCSVVNHACKNLPLLHPIEVIYTKTTRPKLHYDEIPRDPKILMASYALRDIELSGYDTILIVDDVMTQGTSFRAMSDTIRAKYPEIFIAGLAWAVTVWEEENLFADLDFEAEF